MNAASVVLVDWRGAWNGVWGHGCFLMRKMILRKFRSSDEGLPQFVTNARAPIRKPGMARIMSETIVVADSTAAEEDSVAAQAPFPAAPCRMCLSMDPR